MRPTRFMMALLLVTVAGCGEPAGPDARLQVDLEVSADAVMPGGPVAITVTVTNLSSDPVIIDALGCPGPFVVLNADGDVVGPEQRLCTLVPHRVEIAPGGRHVFEDSWFGLSNEEERPGVPARLDTGDYWLQGLVRTPGGWLRSAPVRFRMDGASWEVAEP